MSATARTRATRFFSIALVGVGIALIVETALLGGGVGYFLGALLALAGVLRLYLSRR